MMDAYDLPALWRDDGCEFHPACLSCPLPRCRYDAGGWQLAMAERRRERDARVLAALGDGVPHNEVLERHNISRRTLYRIIEQGRGQ